MFDFWHLSTFKYYPHFVTLYSLFFIGYIALRILKKKLDKQERLKRKIAFNFGSWLLFLSLSGFFFLFSRWAQIYFLSMEFFHILIMITFGLNVIYYAWRLKVGYKRKKKTNKQ